MSSRRTPLFKDEKMNSINVILLSELFSIHSYFERLIFAITKLEELEQTPSCRRLFADTQFEIKQFFDNNFPEYFEPIEIEFQSSKFTKTVKNYFQFFEALTNLPFPSQKTKEILVDYINLISVLSHNIHNYAIKHTSYDIEYPSLGLLKEVPNLGDEEQLENALKFSIDEKDIAELEFELKNNSKFHFLNLKREEKYNFFVHQAHKQISSKNFESALQNFIKAKNYHETAEIYNLIGWCHSLMGENEIAKNFCLKAIKINDQYGPAYNDYGNYLLNEGKVKESLIWFEKAKNCTQYQNREFPYINAGRAKALMQDYKSALEEFSYALTLAPFQDELHDTVAKLKLKIDENGLFHSNPHI